MTEQLHPVSLKVMRFVSRMTPKPHIQLKASKGSADGAGVGVVPNIETYMNT